MIKRGLFLSDLHCGHLVGLTPPEFQMQYHKDATTKHNKWVKIQQELYRTYEQMLDDLPQLDFLCFVGDLIDGKGKRQASSDLITADIDTPLHEVLELMQQHQIRHVLITEEGCITGLFSLRDLIDVERQLFETTISSE